MDVSLWAWVAVVGIVVLALALDLFVLHRKPHEVSLREAGIASIVWVTLGVGFGLLIWNSYGSQYAGEYYAGYLIEKALSVENVFVFALVLGYFAVPKEYQHRVLFLGVIGALVFRAIFIALGATLLESFAWTTFIFGAFLVFTGTKMARHKQMEVHLERNPIIRLVRRLVPMTDRWHGQRFFTKENGKRLATPMLAVLIAIETTDIVFAIDSIPAIFAVTDETFIVFAANAFAICGLRALYFLLAGAMSRLSYLKLGLSAVLIFVGIKMLAKEWWHPPIMISLSVIVSILLVSIAASLLRQSDDDDSLPPSTNHDSDGSSVFPQPIPVIVQTSSRHRVR